MGISDRLLRFLLLYLYQYVFKDVVRYFRVKFDWHQRFRLEYLSQRLSILSWKAYFLRPEKKIDGAIPNENHMKHVHFFGSYLHNLFWHLPNTNSKVD